MAVFTPISRAQLLDFLEDYDLGTLESFAGIPQGVENTNYLVYTNKGRFILTLFERRTPAAELPFFFAFMDHLSRKGINCPRALPDREGNILSTLAGRPAALISFLDGNPVAEAGLTPDHCRQLGAFVARLHLAAADFRQDRKNSMGLKAWQTLAAKTADRADEVEPGLHALIEEELAFLADRWERIVLPEAVIHADIFPDNVFFKDGQVYGLIDFYFSCTGWLAYDLALIINAWCFDTWNVFKPERYNALMEGYQSIRPLAIEESENLSLMGRAAAVRILMTRLHDFVFHDPASLVTPKDPRAYSIRLRFHREGALDD